VDLGRLPYQTVTDSIRLQQRAHKEISPSIDIIMSLHLSILRKSEMRQQKKGMHKRIPSSSTELLDAPDEDPIFVQQERSPLNYHRVIAHPKESTLGDPNIIVKTLSSKQTPSLSSAEITSRLSKDEMRSPQSLPIEAQKEGFESGFETFNDFLNYSSSCNPEEDEPTNKRKRTCNNLKQKLKRPKTKRMMFHVKKQLKRIHTNSGVIVRGISNAAAIAFRGVLFLTANSLIVLTLILSLV